MSSIYKLMEPYSNGSVMPASIVLALLTAATVYNGH